jgi:O-antigen/teichoic acid export membrane protein
MARTRYFLRSLSSSYLLLLGNTISTLVSLPLALHFLERSEYTVWLVVNQVSTYLSLIDLGMSGSGIRLLVDYKYAPAKGDYGGLIKSMFFAQVIQALIILALGMSSAGLLPGLLKNIPPEFVNDFRVLWLWQVVFLALSFAFRIGTQILYAHQRMDVSNYALLGAAVLNIGILIAGLCAGLRLASFIIAQGVSMVAMLLVVNVACLRLKLLPPRGAWGSVSITHLKQLFGLGGEFFLIIVGSTVITGSQGLLLTRFQNFDEALIWSVMTKLFTLSQQIVLKIIGGANSAFSEMFVRGEMDRLWKRYRSVFELSLLASGYFGLLIGFGNNALVKIWTNKAITWDPTINWPLAVWLVLLTLVACHTSLLLYLKQTRLLKFVYVGEASFFVVLAALVIPRWGLLGMLLCSIFCAALFTAFAGTYKIFGVMGQRTRTNSVEWLFPLVRFLGVMLPPGVVLAYLAGDSAWFRLLGCVLPLAVLGPIVAARFCLPREPVVELITHLPAPLRKVASALVGVRHLEGSFTT